MNKPYVYLIGWSNLDKYYYGVRYSNDCQPSDLMETYFTSSKYVHQFIEDNGLPDIVSIRKTFDKTDSARKWESKVLKRMSVKTDDRFINKTDNISMPLIKGEDHWAFGKSRVFTEEWKHNMSQSFKGRKGTFTGLKHTQASKDKISKAKLSKQKITCEHCKKAVSEGNYYRWHGDQCGKIKSSGTEKMIKIENIIYKSISEAAKAMGVSNSTITYRVKSTNFNYSLVGGV